MQIELAHNGVKYILAMITEGVWVFEVGAVTSVDHATALDANEAAKAYLERCASGQWSNSLRVYQKQERAGGV